MIRTRTKSALGVTATSVLLLALGVAVPRARSGPVTSTNVGLADANYDDETERPIGDFLERQGAFCIRFDFGEFAYVATRDDSCPFDEFLFVPPVDNFIGWTDPETLLGISLDYAGLADDALGGSLGTEFEGEITERLLPDGRAEVTVELETENALTFVVDGFVFGGGPLLLGERVAADGTIENPVLGESSLELVFINTAPGADLPDLLQLFFVPEPGQEIIFLLFEGEAESEEGEVKVTQICPAPCSENGLFFSVETIELKLEDDDDDDDDDD